MYNPTGRPIFQNVSSFPEQKVVTNPSPAPSSPGTWKDPVYSFFAQNLPNMSEADRQEIDSLMSKAPKYQSITDLRGNLRPQYQLNSDPYTRALSNVKMDNGAYNQIRNQALWDPATQGDSPWVKMMKDQMALQQQNSAQDLAQSGAANAAMARAQLASRGGLAGGAAVSLAKAGARELSRGQQQLARDAMMQQSNLGIQDYQMRQDMLGKLSGLDMDRYRAEMDRQRSIADLGMGAQKFNIGNMIGNMNNKYNADLGIWNMLGNLTGSYRNARAVENNN